MASGSCSQQEMTEEDEIPIHAQIPYGIKWHVIMDVIVIFDSARRGNMNHHALEKIIKCNRWILDKIEVFYESVEKEYLKVREEMEIYREAIQSSSSQIIKEFMNKEFMKKEQHTEYLDLACNYAKFLIYLGQGDEHTKELSHLTNAYDRVRIATCQYESRWHHEAPALSFNVLSDHQNQKKDIHFNIQNFGEYYRRETRRQQYLNNSRKTSDNIFPFPCCRFKFLKGEYAEYRQLMLKNSTRLQKMRKQTQNNREKARNSFIEQIRARSGSLRSLEEKDLHQSPSNASSPSTDNNKIEQLFSELDINRQNHLSTSNSSSDTSSEPSDNNGAD